MKRVFASALLGLFLIPFAVASFASDWANWRDPLFEDVKRAYIFVDYHTSHIEENDVPEILRRQNIEKRIYELYRKRFSSSECRSIIDYKKPYSCDDQPVMLVPEEERSSFLRGRDTSFATAKELKDKGTLIAVLSIAITGDAERWYDPKIDVPILSFYLTQVRSGAKDSFIIPRISGPIAFPINQSEKSIELHLFQNIQGSIK